MKLQDFLISMISVCIVASMLFLSGCVTKQETLMNNKRQEVFHDLNKKKVYKPVTITGIKQISGDNITITTEAEHKVIQAPDIQYDQSDAEFGKTLVNAAGIVTGLKFLSDTQKVQVVEQPEPTIVQPEVIVVE